MKNISKIAFEILASEKPATQRKEVIKVLKSKYRLDARSGGATTIKVDIPRESKQFYIDIGNYMYNEGWNFHDTSGIMGDLGILFHPSWDKPAEKDSSWDSYIKARKTK